MIWQKARVREGGGRRRGSQILHSRGVLDLGSCGWAGRWQEGGAANPLERVFWGPAGAMGQNRVVGEAEGGAEEVQGRGGG